ncbi:unnamed protein product [Blepharisma stoltei]|uniref:FYVE-type domain-containing protein n=1 Tax=Blepharisma stoltei TaxID=1481888 RepID=A0AAU9J0P3_9CILI|nr:unnamed protein product [Blepharisma stoltei]
MGSGSWRRHEEFDRKTLKIEGFVYVWSSKSNEFSRKWVNLNDEIITFSKEKGSYVPLYGSISKHFKLVFEDLLTLEMIIECFNNKGKLKNWKFKFNNQAEFLQWSEICQKITRPKWDDRILSKTCKCCEKKFTTFLRQHHCRKCGAAVCKWHSTTRISLPELGYFKKVRICQNCADFIK